MKKNEIWLVKIPPSFGHEQSGFRPAIIINQNLNIITIIPLTSNEKALNYLFTLKINPNKENNLSRTSIALIFQIRAIDKNKLYKKLGELTQEESEKIDLTLENYLFNKKTIIKNEKLKKYFEITSTALKQVKKNIIKGKENYAKEIIGMVENYLSDAKHFQTKKDFVNCFGALNYAHGWLDAGVRLDVFDVKDSKLFTIK